MKRKKRKLQLSRNTVRTLADDQLSNAAGGGMMQTVNRCSSENTLLRPGTGRHYK